MVAALLQATGAAYLNELHVDLEVRHVHGEVVRHIALDASKDGSGRTRHHTNVVRLQAAQSESLPSAWIPMMPHGWKTMQDDTLPMQDGTLPKQGDDLPMHDDSFLA